MRDQAVTVEDQGGTRRPGIGELLDPPDLVAQDPVALGLCSQIDLDIEVQKAATRLERERAEQRKKLEKAGTLLPTSETVPGLGPQPDIDLDAVFPEPSEQPAQKPDEEGEEAAAGQDAESAERDEIKTDQT